MSDRDGSFRNYDDWDLYGDDQWTPPRSDFGSDRFPPQNDDFDRFTPPYDDFLVDGLTPIPDSTENLINFVKRKRKKKSKFICFFICDLIKEFFTSPPDKYVHIKTFLGFPFGGLIGLGLYYGIIDGLDLSPGARQVTGSMMALCIACGYSLSVQARCMCWLIIPIFFGKTGRAYVMTFAISFLIAGPIQNIILNGKEVTRSITCATELVVNHSVTKWGLKMKPLTNVMEDFQREGLFLNMVMKKIDKAFSPLKKEIRKRGVKEDEMKKRTQQVDSVTNNARGTRVSSIESRNVVGARTEREEKIERVYRKRSEYQCEDVWNKAVLECRNKFRQLERDCRARIPIIGYLLCLPLKLTFFCELVRVIPGALGMSCDSMEVVNPGFGETYVKSEETVAELDKGFEVNLQYKLIKSPEEIDYTTADEVRQKTVMEFEKKQVLMQFVLTLMKRVLAFTFILVFISAYKYNKMYLTDFRYDNLYISSYFRRIDARRRAAGKFVLLPLKKAERAGVIYPLSLKLMKTEKRKLTKQTFMLITRVLISWVIIASDRLLFNVMDIISKHSRIDYRQQGVHHIKISVYGQGFMSDIVRVFLQGFNSNDNIDHVTTNFECLPRPKEMENKYISLIFGVYGIVWFLMLTEAYGLRLRRLVAGFFYRKREKRRTLFLYNDMLKKRRGFLRHMRHTVRKQARRDALSVKTTIFYALNQQFPKLCWCMKMCKSTKINCLICGDPENKFFCKCETPGCEFGYCEECWYDVKGRCYACMPFDDDDDESELTDDEIMD